MTDRMSHGYSARNRKLPEKMSLKTMKRTPGTSVRRRMKKKTTEALPSR